MPEIYGNFHEQGNDTISLALHISPHVDSINDHWQNNGISADFLANFWANATRQDDYAWQIRQNEIKQAISYIANELLENAIKYGYKLSEDAYNLTMHFNHNHLRFYLTNTIDPKKASQFKALILTLLIEDSLELQLQQIKRHVYGLTQNSGLGFLTMINGYQANLAWKFKNQADIIRVTTMVELAI